MIVAQPDNVVSMLARWGKPETVSHHGTIMLNVDDDGIGHRFHFDGFNNVECYANRDDAAPCAFRHVWVECSEICDVVRHAR
jgi:hypothetical protein